MPTLSLRASAAAGLVLLLGVACGGSETGLPRDVVVFLGDSLIHDGAWQKAFPDVAVVNLGVKGDTVMDVAARLDELNDPRLRVVKLFLLIGTNDARHRMPSRQLAGHYSLLLRLLREILPETRIYLMSLPPCGAKHREIVLALNQRIREAAAFHGLTHICLYPEFVAADGSLREAYGIDGIHLSDAGYQRWVELIAPYVNGDAVEASHEGGASPGPL